jgi:hypothetical protein
MFCMVTVFSGSVYADAGSGSGDVRRLEKQISNLQNLISRQNQEIQSLKSDIGTGGERVVKVPKPMDKNDFKILAGKAYKWLPGLKMKGDLRLRWEAFDSSRCDPTAAGNCDRSRNRFRIRLRWGLEKKLSNEFKVGFRLASGGTTDPTSTNQTMTGYFTNKTITIDQAYAVYTPNLFKDLGPIEYLEIGGGKVPLPFKKYSSKMIWDRDVTPEGIYEKATIDVWSSENWIIKYDIIAGQFVLNEGSGANVDAELFAVQMGIDLSTYAFGTNRPIESRTGFSMYFYKNFDRTIANNTAGRNYLRGNTTDVAHMSVLDLYQEFKMYPFDLPFTVWGEAATNAGQMNMSATLDPRDDWAFAIGTKLGKAKKKGTWEGFLNYMYIGANSTAAVFSDSDFGLGHTNGKGWNFGLKYALTDFLKLGWSNFVVQPVEPTRASSNSESQTIYRSQLDLVWKF